MGLINVPVGGQARSIHVQQIINLIRGLPSYSEAVNFTGINSDTQYSLSVGNRGDLGQGFRVFGSDGSGGVSTTIFEAKNAGIIVRPHASATTAFRVRNAADNADLFSVAADGTVSIGSASVATTNTTQTLTQKTLNAPTLNSPVVSDFVDLANQGVAPANPANGFLRLYEQSNALIHRSNTGVVRTVLTVEGNETVSAKTFNTPTLNAGVVQNYFDLTQVAAPGAPGAGIHRLYAVTPIGADAGKNLLRFAFNGGTKELVDTDTPQTLTNKTLNFSSAYVGLSYGASPGGTANTFRVWTDGANVYYTRPDGTYVTLLSSANTPTVSALSFARSVMTGAIG